MFIAVGVVVALLVIGIIAGIGIGYIIYCIMLPRQQ